MKNFFKAVGAVVGYLALYLLMIFIVTLGAMIAHLLMGSESLNDSVNYLTSHLLEITIAANVLTLLVYFIIQKLRKRKFKDYLELKLVSVKRLWPIITFGLSFNIVISFLITNLPLPQNIIEDYSSAVGTLNVGSPWASLIATVIVAPIFEEILFRGLILNALRKAMPLTVAVILQALLFGFMHGQILWMAYSFIFGIVLAIARLRYKSLFACIALHFSFNALSALMMALSFNLPESFLPGLLIFIPAVLLASFSVWKFFKNIKPNNQDALAKEAALALE